ncbi:MAG: 50S ribosomal protein L4 [Oscillospiraceae bacterium]|nr:50S ribosomal protein L4 [Clostridiales bacterium]MDD4095116.1 50S ribosomal protein L4 [Oscillospiraceae bacterium]
MAKIDVYNMDGKVTGQIDLSDDIFGIEPNESAMHVVVLNQLANRRQGTHSTKTRHEVSGGGRKPYRQKGTGRARQGSSRSAQHVGGGIIFGPKPRDYSYTVPKKIRRLAMKSALSTKFSAQSIIVLDTLSFEEMKTAKMAGVLKALKIDSPALLVLAEKNPNVEKSARNIPAVKTALVNTINVFDILKYDRFVITKDAAMKVQEVYV